MNYIFGALYAGAGVFIFIQSCRNLVAAVASRRWRTTNGVILFRDLKTTGGWWKQSPGFYLRAEVTYKYEVDGQLLFGERTRFGDSFGLGWGWPALRILRRYPEGASVVVHYHPDHPSEAVLEPGITPAVFGGLGLGVLLTVFGLLSIFNG